MPSNMQIVTLQCLRMLKPISLRTALISMFHFPSTIVPNHDISCVETPLATSCSSASAEDNSSTEARSQGSESETRRFKMSSRSVLRYEGAIGRKSPTYGNMITVQN